MLLHVSLPLFCGHFAGRHLLSCEGASGEQMRCDVRNRGRQRICPVYSLRRFLSVQSASFKNRRHSRDGGNKIVSRLGTADAEYSFQGIQAAMWSQSWPFGSKGKEAGTFAKLGLDLAGDRGDAGLLRDMRRVNGGLAG